MMLKSQDWLICSGDLRALSSVESGRSDLIQLYSTKSTGQTRWVEMRWAENKAVGLGLYSLRIFAIRLQ